MGNGGPAAGASFPGAYPDVVAVGAIDQADQRASFSQVGPHIDIAGPGVGILSTVWDNGFTTMSGTSMATPHVAGVAALVLSINPGLTGAQAAEILRQTARPLRDNPGDPIPNNNYGFGCVDAQAAVNRAGPPVIRPSTLTPCRPTQPVFCRATLSGACRPSVVV
jgi:subtilisin family serine protease